MIKRILGFILTVFIFCSMGAAFAASYTKSNDNSNYSNAADFLYALEIFDNDNRTYTDDYVKRDEFCGWTADILKISGTEGIVGYYKDVTEENQYAESIEALFKINVLSEADNGRFEPKRNITMNEALKVLLAAAGYQEKALTTGGLYSGYYMLAKKLDLLDGLDYNANGEITIGEAAILLKNFLCMEIFEIRSINISEDGDINLGKQMGKTILNKYFNIEYLEEVVTANRYSALLSKSGTDESKVRVGDFDLKIGNTDISKWLGYRVEVYYEIDREEIVYFDVSDKNSVVEIDACNDLQWKDNRLYYYTENGKQVSKQISPETAIIYNNQAAGVFREEFFDVNGRVTLIDSDSNSNYETVIIENFQTFVVNSFNVEFEIISTKDRGGTVDLKGREYEIYDENGKRVDESYVVEWDVLDVLYPEDDGIVVIYRTRKQIFGKIESVSNEYVTVNGKKYKIKKGFSEENGTVLKPGAKGVLYLDVMGNIVSFRTQNEDSGIGYIVKWGARSGIDEKIDLKILLYNHEDRDEMLYTFETTDKLRVDGYGVSSEELGKYLQSIKEQSKQLVVRYKLNADGKITELDTVMLGENEDVKHTLVEDYKAEATEAASMVYQPSMRVFSGKVVMESDAIVFYVPEDGSNGYGAVKLNLPNLKGWSPFTTYKTGADKMAADILVFNRNYNNSGGTPGTYDRMAYIDSIWEEWDTEKDTTYFMVGYWLNNNYYERRVWNEKVINSVEIDETDPENIIISEKKLHAGDLVLITTNAEGEMDNYVLLYDFYNKEIATPVSEGANYNIADYNSAHRVYVGYVYERDGDILALTDKNPEIVVNSARASLSAVYGDDIPEGVLKTEVLKSCVKYRIPSNLRKYEDDRTKGWKGCSTSDILPYTLYGDSCSQVLIHSTYSVSYDAAILN